MKKKNAKNDSAELPIAAETDPIDNVAVPDPVAAATAKKEGVQVVKAVLTTMFNPKGAIDKTMAKFPWYMAVIVSALAFGTFFLQTGLDLYKTGQEEIFYVIKQGGLGLAFGAIGIPIIGAIMWPILKIRKSDFNLTQTVSFVCLSYGATLVYGLIGLVFSLALGWKTALAFGAAGVLWSMGPLMVSIRSASKGDTVTAVILTSLAGGAVLFAWQYLQLV